MAHGLKLSPATNSDGMACRKKIDYLTAELWRLLNLFTSIFSPHYKFSAHKSRKKSALKITGRLIQHYAFTRAVDTTRNVLKHPVHFAQHPFINQYHPHTSSNRQDSKN